MREEVVDREFWVVDVKGFGPPLQVMIYPEFWIHLSRFASLVVLIYTDNTS